MTDTNANPSSDPQKTHGRPEAKDTHIVILGAGFGGTYTAMRLQKMMKKDPGLRVTLVSRDNYFLMTPLLFEAGSGILEPRHAVNPLRPLFYKVQFVEAEVTNVDFENKRVATQLSNGEEYDLPFDQLVIALGGVTNTSLVAGSEHAQGFKTMGDAIHVRNHLIDCFERADIETDPAEVKALMTFVIVGGGLVGVELIGEFTEFVANVNKHYRNIPRDAPQFILLDGGDRIMKEMSEDLSGYAQRILEARGVHIRNNTRVKAIEPGRVVISDTESIASATVILGTGVRPSPLVDTFALAKDRRGRVEVDSCMRSVTYPFVWALGDCAAIPDPRLAGKYYPPLAQHAIRQAKVLAGNITGAVRGEAPKPFIYESKGTLASLGQFKGVGKIFQFKIKGFFAWWVWRSYYLMQMPRMNRRLRIVLDWTITLVFKNDVVKMDVDARPSMSKTKVT